MAALASDPDLYTWQWKPTYPLVLPIIWGVSPGCRIKISAVSPSSSDSFQRVMIAQRAALIVSRCPYNNGGIVSLGPREQFEVQVFGNGIRPPHSVVGDDKLYT